LAKSCGFAVLIFPLPIFFKQPAFIWLIELIKLNH
jgi:hypothetical protein